jgi:hypothetical protein
MSYIELINKLKRHFPGSPAWFLHALALAVFGDVPTTGVVTEQDAIDALRDLGTDCLQVARVLEENRDRP